MSQLDAKTNVDIAMATKDDGVAMKTIAIVTMTFLPATFVSVSNFFKSSHLNILINIGFARHEFLRVRP